MSNKDDLSAELIPCDRADSHGQHGSATMLMAWRSAPPRSCWKCELKDQLEVERSTFSKIRDGGATRKPQYTVRVAPPSPICDAIAGAPSNRSLKVIFLTDGPTRVGA